MQHKGDESGKSFIFSLTHKDKFSLEHKDKATFQCTNNGPSFGINDFHILDQAHI